MQTLISLACLLFFAPLLSLQAQTSGNSDPLTEVFPYLTPSERTELKATFLTALSKDANLTTEWKELLVETGAPMAGLSPAAAEAIRLKILTFEQKLRKAMQKEDAASGSILDQIDKHMPKLHPELTSSASGGNALSNGGGKP